MGSHARMLAALGAVLTLTMASAGSATAATSLVRVEGAGSWSTSADALVDRVAVEHPATPLEVVADGHTVSCAADSPAALLNAAVGASQWSGKPFETAPDSGVFDGLTLTAVRSVALPLTGTPGWSWVAFLGNRWTRDICNSHVTDGFEVLFYPLCDDVKSTKTDCYTGGPLLMRPSAGSTWFETQPVGIVDGLAPVSFSVIEIPVTKRDGTVGPQTSATNATVTTDQGKTGSTVGSPEVPAGTAVVRFDGYGNHWARANWTGRVPVRQDVCATDGMDGHCGTVKPDVNTTPSPFPDAPCITNGRDGNCGTIDTTGPPTHVTNIKQNQVFSRKGAPTKLTGTIDVDRSGLKDVQVRVTRVTTARVVVKPKPKKKTKKKKAARKSTLASASATKKKPAKKKNKVRYRTVKRCTYWSTDTLLFEKAKKCGARYGKWFVADVGDIPTTFSYAFEMRLPAGKYLLEVQSRDADGHPELAEPGRNVLTFTVK